VSVLQISGETAGGQGGFIPLAMA